MFGPDNSRSRRLASARRDSTSAALSCAPTPMPAQAITLPGSESAISMPARIAAWAWSSDMAIVARELRVPCAILRASSRACGATGSATPQSTTDSSSPWMRANTDTGSCEPSSRADQLGGRGAARDADAVDRQAVVGGEQHDLRRAEARLQRVLDQPEPDRQRLEFAEAAHGLAAPLQLLAQGLLEQRVRGGRDQ